MKHGEGRAIAERLIKGADVLIEEFRPGVADRLGIGYDQVKPLNPAIIYCSISGFGQDGPYRDRVGHDINYLSLSGIMSIPGQPDAPPTRPGVPLVDLASGMFAALSIMAALRRKDREGVGERIDVSMFDAMISWMSVRAGRYLIYGEKTENDHLSPLNNVYETRDGKKISLGILESHFWINFCKAAGREDLLQDKRFSSSSGRKRHTDDLLQILGDLISARTLKEWDDILEWREIPYAPVQTMEEAVHDHHVKERGLLEEIEAEGLGRIREVLFPVKFSGHHQEIKSPPPQWGQHTEGLLKELGYSSGEIRALREKGTI